MFTVKRKVNFNFDIFIIKIKFSRQYNELKTKAKDFENQVIIKY